MTEKHTKGPWETFKTSQECYNKNEYPQIWNKHEMVAMVCEGYTHEEEAANARLIAAAPELLEACQAAVDNWHSNPRNFSRELNGTPEWLKLARDAIQKAAGHE